MSRCIYFKLGRWRRRAERAGETPAVPAPYSHFIHLNKKYGSTAASSIRARANG